jgi:hypothetical protein
MAKISKYSNECKRFLRVVGSWDDVCLNVKEMFIWIMCPSARIQLSLLAPQFSHGGGSTRTETANSPCRDDGVGLQLRGHVCGPDRIAHVRSELGFDVYEWNVSPSKSS